MNATPFAFDPEIVAGVLHHMNDDHADDSLLFARAFGNPRAVSARMVGLDGDGGDWVYSVDGGDHELRIDWSAPITERPQIRREIVAVYDRACTVLGITPRAHE